ncbi:MAG: hypothetical protein ACI4JQ_06290 [Ruminococcus sp.]
MITMKRRNAKPDHTIIYMEVYGVNRVIYRVTAGTIHRKGKPVSVYGVTLEDVRTGERESLENFSEDMEHTVQFTNALVRRRVRPDGLYNEALRQLHSEKTGSAQRAAGSSTPSPYLSLKTDRHQPLPQGRGAKQL